MVTLILFHKQDVLSRGRTPDLSLQRVDDLKAEWRRLQQDLKQERGTIDNLKKERVDLESEVHRLRLAKESHERKVT